ncbi:MAG: PIN domain-containing protein [Alphaproteobacteria bacterium]|nr:PIN domain-containing protein [Alphaproteobacteria bacterium]
MILLDTNVVSELMSDRANPAVVAWIDAQQRTDLFVSSIAVAEILYGLRAMPAGRRRDGLSLRFEQFIREVFADRELGFDERAAKAYADIRGARKEMGRPMSNFDGQIAAIAQVHGLAIATRNTRDFEGAGLDLVNPFETAA